MYGSDYNRTYELYQKAEDNNISIEWNKEKKNVREEDKREKYKHVHTSHPKDSKITQIS